MNGISEQQIRERAYQIWEREGCPNGRDFEHWVQAQVELGAQSKGNGGLKAAAPRSGSAVPKAGSAPVAKKVPPAQTPARRGKRSG